MDNAALKLRQKAMSYNFRPGTSTNRDLNVTRGIWSVGGELLVGGGKFFLVAVRRRSRFGADYVLAILRWANPTDATKNLCEVLLRLEPTGHRHIQHPRIGSTQHRFGALKAMAQNKLMRGFAG